MEQFDVKKQNTNIQNYSNENEGTIQYEKSKEKHSNCLLEWKSSFISCADFPRLL